MVFTLEQNVCFWGSTFGVFWISETLLSKIEEAGFRFELERMWARSFSVRGGGFGWLTEPVTGFRMVKGEGFSAQFRFNSLAQGAHLTGSIKLLTRPIRSASALFGGFALRFSAFFLSSLAVVSSLSFPSFLSAFLDQD